MSGCQQNQTSMRQNDYASLRTSPVSRWARERCSWGFLSLKESLPYLKGIPVGNEKNIPVLVILLQFRNKKGYTGTNIFGGFHIPLPIVSISFVMLPHPEIVAVVTAVVFPEIPLPQAHILPGKGAAQDFRSQRRRFPGTEKIGCDDQGCLLQIGFFSSPLLSGGGPGG